MNILDTRELMTVSTATVWSLISNLANNTIWQVDCRSISFLTTHHTGEGVRWRSTAVSGREMVYEITVWYEGLGYEYTIVDGSPFGENKGRIRLQDVPEGTVVQWTFSYETKGLLGSIKDTLSLKRRTEEQMTESLKRLRKGIDRSMPRQEIQEAKSLMRDAPDAEARKNYKPRHPSAVADLVQGTSTSPDTERVPSRPIILDEPPLSDDDTRPRISSSQTAPTSDPVSEPSFLAANEDRFKPPAGFESEIPSLSVPPENVIVPESDAGQSLSVVEASVAVSPHEEPFASKTSEQFEEAQPLNPLPDEAQESDPSGIPTIVHPAPLPPPPTVPSGFEPIPLEKLGRRDTSEVSIWEVFGVPRPSASQQMPKVQIESLEKQQKDPVTEEPAIASTPAIEAMAELKPELPVQIEPAAPLVAPPQPPRLPEESRLMTAVFAVQPTPYPYRVGLRLMNRRRRAIVRHPNPLK